MEWIFDKRDPLLETMIGSIMIFSVIILLTRIIGLRSFAKFTVYDFAFTIAIGSIISSTLTSGTSIVHGSVLRSAVIFQFLRVLNFLQVSDFPSSTEAVYSKL